MNLLFQKQKSQQPEITPKLRELIEKRITHNALIQGTAINHFSDALPLVRNELDEIDSNLYRKYLLHNCLTELIQVLAPVPEEAVLRVAGEKRVSWRETGKHPKIIAKGFLFPILVQELSKGVWKPLWRTVCHKNGLV